MCELKNTVLGRAHTYMDKQRTHFSKKIGIGAPRDFMSEWINGKSVSMYGKGPKAKPAPTPEPTTPAPIMRINR